RREVQEVRREVQDVKQELKRDNQELRRELKQDMKELELRMTIKLGGFVILGVGLLLGMLRVWPIPTQYAHPPVTHETPLAKPAK
ncbi:MAG: hypothetical protein HQL65_10670, partial [Magnetococcales bacterium]|nr:hypothetical protein [Magnetococcales bacterium]